VHRSARKKIRWVILSIAVVIVTFLVAREILYNSRLTASFPKPANRREAWMQDLEHFQQNYYKASSSFPEDSIKNSNEIIDSIRRSIDNFSDAKIQLLISRCVSMADDSHTRVFFGNFRRIDLRMYFFDDGLYVVKAKHGFEKFLGAKITRIENKSIEDILHIIDRNMPGNKSWIEYKSSFFFASPDFLEAADISTTADSVRYEFVQGADTITHYFKPQKIDDKHNEYTSWRDLSPLSSELSDTVGWKHLLSANSLPLYLTNPDTTAHVTYIDSLETLYIQINTCAGIDRERAYIDSVIDSRVVQNIVVDLRFNDGGDYTQLINFSSSIPKKFKGSGKIYLISGKTTFSAGICTLARLKYFAGPKGIIIGQAAGDGLQFWAEGKQFRLPNSEIRIRAVNGYHDWKDNTFEPLKTFWLNIFLGVAAKDISPDVEVKQTFEDYSQHRDKVIETIFR
jgi:hypothetical protein